MPNSLIIGSGPSGTSAAITLAQMGLPVVILDREKFPRHHPGETLHPGIEPLLKQLGVAEQILSANFLRHPGNWVKWEAEPRFVPFGADETETWQGFQAWRADFDRILLEKAIKLGVEVRQPCRALQPIFGQNRISGVVTSDGELPATFVIDATGNSHWLAKQLNLPIRYYSPRLIAYFGYAEGECPMRYETPAIIADENGWTWTARVRSQVYQWTRLSFTNQSVEKDWLPNEFRLLKSQGKIGAADVSWRIVNPCASFGYFLVGDAAAVLDPASSHGVLKAMMSGIMAAHLIGQIVRGRSEFEATKCYCQWFNNWFHHDVEKLREFYSILPNAPDWVLNNSSDLYCL